RGSPRPRDGRFPYRHLGATVAVQVLAVEVLAIQKFAVRLDAIHPDAVGIGAVLLRGLRRQLFRLLQRLALRLGLQAQFLGPRLGALLLALLFAGRAFAADRLQIGFEVIGAVVVIDLFARLDVLDGADEHLAFAWANVGFRVRLAGVIDIAGDVRAHRTVDGPAIGE